MEATEGVTAVVAGERGEEGGAKNEVLRMRVGERDRLLRMLSECAVALDAHSLAVESAAAEELGANAAPLFRCERQRLLRALSTAIALLQESRVETAYSEEKTGVSCVSIKVSSPRAVEASSTPPLTKALPRSNSRLSVKREETSSLEEKQSPMRFSRPYSSVSRATKGEIHPTAANPQPSSHASRAPSRRKRSPPALKRCITSF